MQMSIKENMVLSNEQSDTYKTGKFLDNKKINAKAKELVDEFDVRPTDIDYKAGSLSGGNQQKVILAREVDRHPKMMIAIQPTRGLDIGAIEFVRNKLIEERGRQTAVMLISTDLDEILSLSDRILVMHGGEFMGEVTYDVPIDKIGLMMAGQRAEGGAE